MAHDLNNPSTGNEGDDKGRPQAKVPLKRLCQSFLASDVDAHSTMCSDGHASKALKAPSLFLLAK